jgi:hypothetical protein
MRISGSMLETESVFFEWPMGKWKGKTIRTYHPIGKYTITSYGNELFTVTEKGKANKRGGKDAGIDFKTLKEALDYIHDLVH